MIEILRDIEKYRKQFKKNADILLKLLLLIQITDSFIIKNR